ncbi:unnamed protein product [Oppiella nova]|uniref:Transporter n=1 Tax=Oppiella nova TaxID=334625 RepID=A0A7R9LBL2_9ACAR|nr:unnamed protein product [Oppiella nova]CAG2161766.1 unnamed protein product [Oppiella nova]
MISKWKQKFSKFRTQLAIRKICKENEKNNTNALQKNESLENDKIENGEQERLEWSKKIDFLLSIIGFAVDLSNVWRFPYLCYKNGGGVFLIPYTIMLVFGALPLFFLELSVGQFTKCGPITMWNKLCPPMKGIGYCCVLISWYVSFYYNVIIAWTTYYIFKSLTSGDLMPWQHCDNDYNTDNCFSVSQMQAIQCQTNTSHHKNNGVKSSGKVVWFTATAPYFILTILLIRGLFLPGAGEGILYYINPRLEKLLEPSVWVDAAVQVFYSIGVGFGVHLTYASFNKFNNNCYRDCLITACVNSLTSFYSGFVIFTYLGYMANSMNKEIQNVASEGYGLMGGLEAVITGLMDEFRFKKLKREYFTAIVISTSFLGALVNCTQGGGYTMVWFDTYSAGISLLCSAMFEALAVVYFYGSDRFSGDIQSMLGYPPSRYWVLSWKYISPIFLMCVIVLSIINSERLSYYNYDYPIWSAVLGWAFTLSSVSAVPIYALIWWIRKVNAKRNVNSNCVDLKEISERTAITKSNNSPVYV